MVKLGVNLIRNNEIKKKRAKVKLRYKLKGVGELLFSHAL